MFPPPLNFEQDREDSVRKVFLFHFKQDEVPERTALIQSFGYAVDSSLPTGPDFFKTFKENLPDVIVIDLSHRPSQGRDIGIYMRHTKATRSVPLVFVDGQPDKIKKVQENLPDAIYSTWDSLRDDLQNAIKNPLEKVVVPESTLAGYSGTPLPKKLGIKAGMVIGLVHAPDTFTTTLGDLPTTATIIHKATHECSLLLWFLRSSGQLKAEIVEMVNYAKHARIWMIWPKKTSLLACDLTQQQVRDIGLAAGLVDYKICAVDENWSGLLFTKKN